MQTEMTDRIAAALRERGEALSAASIASDFLRLTGADGPAARALVRAVLSADRRFEEVAEGRWGLARPKRRLSPPVVLCHLERPPGTQRAPWLWGVRARLWGEESPILAHRGAERSGDLGSLFRWFRDYPIACRQPGSLGRWIGAQERIHALPEVSAVVLDVRAWQKRLAPPVPAPGGRSVHAAPRGPVPPADTGPEWEAMGRLLEELVAHAHEQGLHTWRDVALWPGAVREETRRQLWQTDWSFSSDDVAHLPEQPGVYRFLASDGAVLYVGKAKNLRQRISSYFRPLEEASSRRAEFLRQIQRFEYDTTATELEALIREAQAIRAHRPTWNVQVQLGTGEGAYPIGEEDLLIMVPGAESGFSVFALGGDRVVLRTIDGELDPEAWGRALRSFYVEGEVGEGFEEILSPERVLVRRWLGWSRDACTTFRLADFSTFATLVEALRTAVASPPDTVPAILRDGTDF